jgi:oligoribonuclease
MRYVSIDLETTGLDPENCQVLSIGAVIEDTNDIKPLDELPTFHGVIKRRAISGETYAINMNRDLIQTMVNYMESRVEEEKTWIEDTTGMRFYDEQEIVQEFYYWLAQNGFIDFNEPSSGGYVTMRDGQMVPAITNKTKPVHITAAGKNFATFDLKFLEKLPRWKQLIKVRQRILDPSILYINWTEDESLPSLGTCKRRANLPEEIAHNAVEDSKDVILLLRKEYNPA